MVIITIKLGVGSRVGHNRTKFLETDMKCKEGLQPQQKLLVPP